MKFFKILKSTIIIVGFLSSLFTSSLETLLKPTPDIKAVEFNDAIVKVPSLISFEEIGHLLEASSIIKEQLAFKGQTLQLPISIKEYRLLSRFLTLFFAKKMESLTSALDSLDYKTLSSLITISDKLSIENLLDQAIDVLIAKLEKNYRDFFAENFLQQFDALTPTIKQYIANKIITKQRSIILLHLNHLPIVGKKELPIPPDVGASTIHYNKLRTKVAFGMFNKSIQIWDMRSKQLLNTLPALQDLEIYAIEFSPDDKKIAVLYSDHSIQIWSLDTGNRIQLNANFSSDIFIDMRRLINLTFNQNGEKIAFSDKQTIHVCNAINGNLLYSRDTVSDIHILQFSSDEKLLVAVDNKNIYLFNASNGELIKQIKHKRDYYYQTPELGAINNDGTKIAFISENGIIVIYDTKNKILINLTDIFSYRSTEWNLLFFIDDNNLALQSYFKEPSGYIRLELTYNLTQLNILSQFLDSITFEQALLFNVLYSCIRSGCTTIDFSNVKDIFETLPPDIQEILLNHYRIKIQVSKTRLQKLFNIFR